MKRLRIIFLVLVMCVVLGGAVWLVGPREPAYGGKRLSVWLDDQQIVEDGRVELSETSVQAVRAIGTNAIPYLLTMLQSTDSPAKLWLAKSLWRHSFIREYFPLSGKKRRRAMYGFRALGLDAKSAIPELVNLVLSPPNGQTQAINALTCAGDEAVVRIAEGLSSSDPEVRRRAAFALGCLRQSPHIALPALTTALNDPDAEVRATAVGALGPYQAHARSIVPEVTRLLNDTNAKVRSCAIEALDRIQPKPVSPELR